MLNYTINTNLTDLYNDNDKPINTYFDLMQDYTNMYNKLDINGYNNIVSLGKYKGKMYNDMIKDREYVKWYVSTVIGSNKTNTADDFLICYNNLYKIEEYLFKTIDIKTIIDNNKDYSKRFLQNYHTFIEQVINANYYYINRTQFTFKKGKYINYQYHTLITHFYERKFTYKFIFESTINEAHKNFLQISYYRKRLFYIIENRDDNEGKYDMKKFISLGYSLKDNIKYFKKSCKDYGIEYYDGIDIFQILKDKELNPILN